MAEETPSQQVEFEKTPLSRAEYIAAMVHLYRGEMGRSLMWRQRMDTTTNWAVFTTGAMLTFLFGARDHFHVVAVLGILLVFFMLCFEARRFRFFSVWRSRVRLMEENFYGPLLRRDLTSPIENWAFLVAEDLMTPRFKCSFLTAMRARLMRNYIPIFLVLYGAWLAKLSVHPVARLMKDYGLTETDGAPLMTALEYTNIGVIPAWLVNGIVFGLAVFMFLTLILAKSRPSKEDRYWSARSDESIDEFS